MTSQVQYGLYKEGGVHIDGPLQDFGRAANDIDTYSVSLYIEYAPPSLILASQFIVKKTEGEAGHEGRDERRVYFQDFSGKDAVSSVAQTCIDFFLYAQTEFEAPEKSHFSVIRVAKEKLLFKDFLALLDAAVESSDEALKGTKSSIAPSIEVIIGKIVADKTFTIQVEDFFEAITALSHTLHEIGDKLKMPLVIGIAGSNLPFKADLQFLYLGGRDVDYVFSTSNLKVKQREQQQFKICGREYLKNEKYRRGFYDRVQLAKELMLQYYRRDPRALLQEKDISLLDYEYQRIILDHLKSVIEDGFYEELTEEYKLKLVNFVLNKQILVVPSSVEINPTDIGLVFAVEDAPSKGIVERLWDSMLLIIFLVIVLIMIISGLMLLFILGIIDKSYLLQIFKLLPIK